MGLLCSRRVLCCNPLVVRGRLISDARTRLDRVVMCGLCEGHWECKDTSYRDEIWEGYRHTSEPPFRLLDSTFDITVSTTPYPLPFHTSCVV